MAAKHTALPLFTPIPEIRAKDTTKSEAAFQGILILLKVSNGIRCLYYVDAVDMDHHRRIRSDRASDPTKYTQRKTRSIVRAKRLEADKVVL